MKTLNQFFEEQSDYEKAWEKHRAEMDHLKAHKFEQHWDGGRDKDTGASRKGVQRYVKDKDRSRGVEHQQQIYWHHDNMTRKNSKVKTHEVKTEYAGTPHSRVLSRIEKEHKSLAHAVKYLNAKHKEVTGKPFKA